MAELRQINGFVFKKVKALCGFEYNSHVSYERIEEKCREVGINILWPANEIKIKRVKLYGHKIRHLKIPEARTGWRRPRGRPFTNMRSLVMKDMNIQGSNLERKMHNMKMLAENRDEWRRRAELL